MANIFQAKKTVNLSSGANAKQNVIEDQVASTAASTGNPWLVAGAAVLKATSAGYDAIQKQMDEKGGSIMGNVGQAVISPHKWVGKMIDHGWMGDDAWKKKKLSEANPDSIDDSSYARGAGTAITRGAGDENIVTTHTLTGVTDEKNIGASLMQAAGYAGSAISKGVSKTNFKDSMKDTFGGIFKNSDEIIPDNVIPEGKSLSDVMQRGSGSIGGNIINNTNSFENGVTEKRFSTDIMKTKNSIFVDQSKNQYNDYLSSMNNIENIYNKWRNI